MLVINMLSDHVVVGFKIFDGITPMTFTSLKVYPRQRRLIKYSLLAVFTNVTSQSSVNDDLPIRLTIARGPCSAEI